MTVDVYRITCGPELPLAEAELSLELARLAVEGLLGKTRVLLETTSFVDVPRRAILLDGTTPAGASLVRIFTHYLLAEFGSAAFSVSRMDMAHAAGKGTL